VERKRTFAHADGRKARLSLERTSFVNDLLLAGDPDPVVRRRQFPDSREAASAFEQLASELIANGFSETTDHGVPPLNILNELVDAWRYQDPTFDVEALAAPLRSAGHEALWEALHRVEEPVWIASADGKLHYDTERRERDWSLARDVLLREDDATDAALLLALRSDARLYDRFDLLFGERRLIPLETAFPVFLSCLSRYEVSRNTLAVASILNSHYRPLPDRFADQLLPLLSSPDDQTRAAAGSVLAPRARERRYFDPIWARRDENERMMFAAMSACEARRDPMTLPWFETLYKKRMGPGWKETVDDTVARVRGEIPRRPGE
jgi:hypothetical protein